ncbi:hypothetical protein RSOLAG1IB_10505 [Rhizoctonia solani AG-1 IB]|uniref:Uncharacterized protein n=1 Tax=Thanatephorus cucumeris (strain AG1-IB / isolate 7/3/14) TaxID=1108050 RepID=A0A0B7FXY0_THACB|nr:hypothetical protein RSOLAG1IB_10505 [Rhizoctonia solani AG-1 IB]
MYVLPKGFPNVVKLASGYQIRGRVHFRTTNACAPIAHSWREHTHALNRRARMSMISRVHTMPRRQCVNRLASLKSLWLLQSAR